MPDSDPTKSKSSSAADTTRLARLEAIARARRVEEAKATALGNRSNARGGPRGRPSPTPAPSSAPIPVARPMSSSTPIRDEGARIAARIGADNVNPIPVPGGAKPPRRITPNVLADPKPDVTDVSSQGRVSGRVDALLKMLYEPQSLSASEPVTPASTPAPDVLLNKNNEPIVKVTLGDDTTTHRLSDLDKVLAEGETPQDYVQRVLSRRDFPDSVKRTENRIEALAPDAVPPIQSFIAALEKEGLKVDVRETARPQERQEWLFQQGRSRKGQIVTWTTTSDHSNRRAIDIFINGDSTGSDPGYEKAWEIAKRLGIDAIGANDPGHFAVPMGAPAKQGTSPRP